jgi:hypothetical protein
MVHKVQQVHKVLAVLDHQEVLVHKVNKVLKEMKVHRVV